MTTFDIASVPGDRVHEIIDANGWPGPMPVVDVSNELYFRAAAEGVLLIERCPVCHAAQHYPRGICIACGATPEWEAASGRGTIYTYSIVRQAGMLPFSERVPYVVALIDLDEGPRLVGNVIDCAPEDVAIEAGVRCVMERATTEIGWPQWRLAT